MRLLTLKPLALLGAVLLSTLLGGCNATQVSKVEEQTIRDTARSFTIALKEADPSKLQTVTTIAPDSSSQRLAEAVTADSLSGRKIQQQLSNRFHTNASKSAIGSDAWIAQMEVAAAQGKILRDGDRVLVGELGRDGSLYLRQTNGQWKVELIPTLVAESGGRPTINDPAVEYRFNVTRSLNHWMLQRLTENEFRSEAAYTRARSEFWIKYLTFASAGQDPHDKLVSWLPPMPHNSRATADDR